jgi:hypothetical protein
MIDIKLHFKGTTNKTMRLAALPQIGDHIADNGQLWRVDSILLNPAPQVYCLAVGDDRRDELETAWATWSDPSTATDTQDETATKTKCKGCRCKNALEA